ncbi:MAG TPA: ATP-binding cassette domain-containing protein [Terriglobia bacterium]|nr:ATP-binding cassette domain-containing protein [Terriglobia bacterium]
MNNAVLEMTDATVMKNGARILDGLTLKIRIDEHTAIVGPNGAGKTTLMNVLTRQDYPLARDNGVPPVQIFGSTNWNVFELRSQLGIVTTDLHHRFVNGNAAGSISGVQAVLSGFFATQGFVNHGSLTDEMQRKAADALARMEANHLGAKPLDEMSTGEARRVLIARALVTEPKALVLDEPTAGLDLVARHRFLKLVSRIAREGTTIVLVTHHVEEIIPQIENVVLLKQGRVAFAGPKGSILTSERLSSVMDAPISLQEINGFYYAAAL